VRRKHFSDDYTSPTFIKEMVIVSDTKKYPTSLVEASLTYAGATSSNVKFMLAENEKMAKNLEDVR